MWSQHGLVVVHWVFLCHVLLVQRLLSIVGQQFPFYLRFLVFLCPPHSSPHVSCILYSLPCLPLLYSLPFPVSFPQSGRIGMVCCCLCSSSVMLRCSSIAVITDIYKAQHHLRATSVVKVMYKKYEGHLVFKWHARLCRLLPLKVLLNKWLKEHNRRLTNLDSPATWSIIVVDWLS